MDFASLDPGDLKKLLNDPKMGEVARDRISRRIRELSQPTQPDWAKHPLPEGETGAQSGSSTRIVKTGKRRGKMNFTETRSYKDWIVPALAKGEIVKAEFEGATWHVHEVAKYTPDWLCWMPPGSEYLIWNIEIKMNGSMRERDKIRFLLHRKARPWMRWTMLMWDRKTRKWIVRYDFPPSAPEVTE